MASLRLVSVNLFSGRSLEGGRVDPDLVSEALAGLDADVLALQEVDHLQDRSLGLDQAALAAKAIGAVDHRFVALVHGTPGEEGWSAATDAHLNDAAISDGHLAAPDDGPGYGIALASRVPVRSWHVLRMAPARGRWPIPLPTRPPRVVWISDEPRAAIAAVLESPRITVACTHLSFVPGRNARHLREVRRWLSGLPGPQVLLGDLNLPGRLPQRLTGWTPLVEGPTFPSPAPRTQLDHVLAADLPHGARATGSVVQLPFSDHRAVSVALDLP